MYGFGDDRNPANDTVNVMEEILIEYIMDVVRAHHVHCRFPAQLISTSAKRLQVVLTARPDCQ
jgi:phosphoribosylcarboxyaminoimidazole (NCAIR) mutase